MKIARFVGAQYIAPAFGKLLYQLKGGKIVRDFILTLLCAVLIADAAFAQPQPPDTLWTRTYGGIDSDRGCCAQQTTDGGYIIAGMTESYGAGGYDVYLIKTNALGDTIWTQTFGGSDDDYGNSVQQTIDGGYIIAGSTNSFSSYGSRVYLIKTNDYGDTLWTKTFGEDGFNSARSIQQTSDGGYIVAGSTNSYGLLYCDVYLIKTDAFGDTLWTKTFGGDYIDYGNSVQQTSDGGYIITGEALANVSGEQDVYLIKTDTYGDTLWTNTFGSDYEEEGISVQQTSDGGYIIAGYTFNSFVWLWDVYLIRTDADGNEIWHQIFVEDDHNWGSCVKQTNDGGYIITSVTEAFGDDYGDVKVIKTDADGDTIWTKTIEEGGYGLSIQQTNDSGYIIGGHKFNSGYSDVILIRLDSEGTIVEGFPTPHPSSCALHHPSPNPFNAETLISFDLPFSSPVEMSVYDIAGREVAELENGEMSAGNHVIPFNGGDLVSGVYFVRLEAGDFVQTRKCVLVK